MFLQTLENRNEKTTNNKKIERNVKNMTTYALVNTKNTNKTNEWEVLDTVTINKEDIMDCNKIRNWYKAVSGSHINPLILYLRMCKLQKDEYDFPYIGRIRRSDTEPLLMITIIENGEIFQP